MRRLVLVGCGAVAEKSWLPALAAAAEIEVTACVDPAFDRARALAARLPGCRPLADWREAVTLGEGAILALPHRLHAEVGAGFLAAGRHVLLEKPMACDGPEAARLLAAARSGSATVTVAQVRRFLPAYRWTKGVLASGLLGRLERVLAEEGGVYGWPAASDSLFRREAAGGGVLLDTGAHVADALRWWLGALTPVACRDDAVGGVEAESEVEFRAGEVRGLLRLSRLRPLPNRVRIEGERGALEVDTFGRWARLEPAGAIEALTGQAAEGGVAAVPTTAELFSRQLAAWLRAVAGTGTDEVVSGEDAAGTVEFLAACYAQRRTVLAPWQRAGTPWAAAEEGE